MLCIHALATSKHKSNTAFKQYQYWSLYTTVNTAKSMCLYLVCRRHTHPTEEGFIMYVWTIDML